MAEELSNPDIDYVPRDADLWRGDRSWLARLWEALPLRRAAIFATIIVFLLSLSLLVYILLYRSARTPIIVVRTAPYSWPFPPVASASEDWAKIAQLGDEQDQHRVAINLAGVSLASSNSKSVLTRLEQLSMPKRCGRVTILYFNVHGAVRYGKPYLVPPGSSPSDEQTWLKVEDLLRQVDDGLKDKGSDTLRLVVLDCSREPVNWHLGWFNNDFASALQKWWNDSGQEEFPHFAILSAAGPGERSWTSRELNGSVFAEFFCRGLAGKADKNPPYFFFQNPAVTLDELADYLKEEVNGWVSKHRADRQQPMVLKGGDSWSNAILTSRSMKMPIDRQERTANVSATDRMELWNALAELRSLDLERTDPLGWRNLEHQLLWLDQLADAGSDYQALAQATLGRLRSRLNGMQERVRRAESAGSIASLTAREGIVSVARRLPVQNLELRSLVLAGFVGSLSPAPQTIDAQRRQLEHLQSNPDLQQLRRARRSLERAGLNDFAEAQFLQMVDRYQFEGLWQNAASLQQLLALRSPTQDLGVPGGGKRVFGDERVHGWIRGLVDAADEARRQVEDRLFVDHQPELAERLQTARQTAEAAGSAMSVLENAIRLRDNVWAELPYLAAWQANPLRRSAGQSDSADSPQSIVQLVELNRQLEVHLSPPGTSAPPGDVAAAVQAVAPLVKQIDAQFSTEFNQKFVDECDNLSSLGNNVSAVQYRHIAAALANPLLPAELRKKLDSQFHSFDESEAAAARDKKADEKSVYSTSDERWTGLAISLFAGDSDTTSDPDAQWQNEIVALQSDVAAAAKAKDGNRQDWNRLDQRLRAVAALVPADLNGMSDRDLGRPAGQLRAIDLRDLMQWHAERVRRDSWGPAGDRQPYFLLAADSYLNNARVLSSFLHDGRDANDDPADVAALRAQVAQQADSAAEWLAIAARDALQIDARDAAHTPIVVSGLPIGSPNVGGMAAVFIERGSLRVDGVACLPTAGVTLPVQSQAIETTIPTSATSHNSEFNAVAMFRGYEVQAPFRCEPLGGVVVDESPPAYGPGRVTLRSPWRNLSVVVVLDCSQSMNQPLEDGQSRLAVAKEALTEMLSALSARSDVRVGVRMFGHRIGWSTDRPVRVLTSPSFAGIVPAGLTPDRDVERVLPLANFDFNAAQVVFTALQGVQQGWGQSPLYLALNQSLAEDFGDAGADSNKHLIVITDGRNYQARAAAADQASASQVAQAARTLGVPIHVLALAPDAPDSPQDAAQFFELARNTEGTNEAITGALDLRRTLQAILQLEMYQLDDSTGRTVGQAELGVPLSDVNQHAPAWYSVRYLNASENVLLEGGEAIDLFVRQGDPRMYALPFDHDVAAETWLQTPAGSGEAFVERVHRPLSSGRNGEFRISLQRGLADSTGKPNGAWLWTPRPKEVWLEIQPLSANGAKAGQTYPYYDANFVPYQPVPVLELAARDWPAGASQAVVSAWYKATATEPEMRLPLTPVEIRLPDGTRFEVRAEFADASRTLYRVRVIERHAVPLTTDDWLKVVPPASAYLRPSRLVRQFDERHGVAVHDFYYADFDESQLAQLQTEGIGVVTRQAAQSGAILAQPVKVLVSTGGEMLPLADNNGSSATTASGAGGSSH